MDISVGTGGAAEPQGLIVQGGGQLPSDRGVGQGLAAGKPGQAPVCWLPASVIETEVYTWDVYSSVAEG